MDKRVSAGIDVSAQWLDACKKMGELSEIARFENTSSGHRRLIAWLGKGGAYARVVLEATGNYSLELAHALHRAARVEVMVANPRAVRKFAEAKLQRARTDRTTAAVLVEFCERMSFVGWKPPSKEQLALRAITRQVADFAAIKAQEKNRLHAASLCEQLPAFVRRQIKLHIRQLEQAIARAESEALKLVDADPVLRRHLRHLQSVKGIAKTTALQILGELAALPDELGPRQWVAYAGLDPKPIQSGTSVHPPVRISKMGNVHLRRALFLPALSALRWDPNVRAFAEKLKAKGKPPMVVAVAVMRKLLHAIYGMFKNDTAFIGQKFFRLATENLTATA
jgi:transposase